MRWIMAAFYGDRRHRPSDARRRVSADRAGLGAVPARGHSRRPALCELAGAAAMLTARWRCLAGIMLALYALCVWPANIKHAVEHIAAAADSGQLVVSRAAAGVSAGADLVGAVLLGRDRLAVAARTMTAVVRCCGRCRLWFSSQSESLPSGAAFFFFAPVAFALAFVFAGGFGAARSAASFARRSALSFSVLARVAEALASYSAIAFLPSSACRARISALTLFGSSANGVPSLWIRAVYGAERAFIQPQFDAARSALRNAADRDEMALQSSCRVSRTRRCSWRCV